MLYEEKKESRKVDTNPTLHNYLVYGILLGIIILRVYQLKNYEA